MIQIKKPAHEQKVLFSNKKQIEVTTEELKTIQNSKCCYCETAVQGEIEHYFPKSKYKWLVGSWQNLFYVCSYCNRKKSNTFDICGTKANETDDCRTCFDKEKPCFVNPELDDSPEKMFSFNDKCEIEAIDSNNCEIGKSRMNYTIEKLDLNNKFLVEQRLLVIKHLKTAILAFVSSGKTKTEIEVLNFIIKIFIKIDVQFTFSPRISGLC